LEELREDLVLVPNSGRSGCLLGLGVEGGVVHASES
jgi:hypothetical protein